MGGAWQYEFSRILDGRHTDLDYSAQCIEPTAIYLRNIRPSAAVPWCLAAERTVLRSLIFRSRRWSAGPCVPVAPASASAAEDRYWTPCARSPDLYPHRSINCPVKLWIRLPDTWLKCLMGGKLGRKRSALPLVQPATTFHKIHTHSFKSDFGRISEGYSYSAIACRYPDIVQYSVSLRRVSSASGNSYGLNCLSVCLSLTLWCNVNKNSPTIMRFSPQGTR